MNVTYYCSLVSQFFSLIGSAQRSCDAHGLLGDRDVDIAITGLPQSRVDASIPASLRQYVELQNPLLGSKIVHVTDQFFADADRMLNQSQPQFISDLYDDHGKWMDGWESRRKRVPGHDYAVIQLGIPGYIRGVGIDTSYFTGNYPPSASLESCSYGQTEADRDKRVNNLNDSNVETCETLLNTTDLQGDSLHYHLIDFDQIVTHVKLNIFPDGGIARIRLYGEIPFDMKSSPMEEAIDLFAMENGGRALISSNQHYGSMHNINLPGPSSGMANGWETARRRSSGNDWVVLKLGAPGTITQIVVDTAYFRGNYPDQVMIQAAYLYPTSCESTEGSIYSRIDAAADTNSTRLSERSEHWTVLLEPQKLSADSNHTYIDEINALGLTSHLRVNIIPDGGIARLRIYANTATE